eukprot:CAMPEP_0119567190 /NCGR_PEP_ID=MMETSP1352-20130426/35245_1 /TAXON_ID=265584 /ORGANISM="Stauroneis constricta, Strain CCMP1120" /LENGTH=88 /DNA_ID=CAMNT_0007616417 /DNA_START=115 /DNA_END=377 /DNA_ORIENTATION=+
MAIMGDDFFRDDDDDDASVVASAIDDVVAAVLSNVGDLNRLNDAPISVPRFFEWSAPTLRGCIFLGTAKTGLDLDLMAEAAVAVPDIG